MKLSELREANIKRTQEWGSDLGISFAGNELAGEVGEACNILKKLDRYEHGIVGGLPPDIKTLRALADELADIVICVDLIAMRFYIDLSAHIPEKFNSTSAKNNLETML
jgi:NTP pyrophosphatase (non-canonical NTP hydrolase)